MRDHDFFQGIQQISESRGEFDFKLPVFYYDITTINVAFVTPIGHIKKRLPSRQLKPLRLTPLHGLTVITAFEYRDSDIGPYNEVSLAFPVSVGKMALPVIGALGALSEPTVFVWHLPVTTEIARIGGIEVAGYPKFIADIEFQRENGWIHCHLAADGQDILTLSVRELKTKRAGRSKLYPITIMGDRILRSEVIVNQPQRGVSMKQDNVKLELGDHAIAQELRALELGRILQVQYMPEHQCILTQAIESWPC